jgi:acetoacetyl-CoA synthetase
MAVEVWDDDGKPVVGEKGELVCTKAFPSMPVGFWNDPDGEKYHAAYFERFDNIWTHGDFAEWTEHGGMIIHGRSDATLNPGGVRIGTAEIYNQVEQMPEVLEALCIGQDWDNDVRVVLFVRLAEGVVLDDALQKKIRAKIRTGASPRHVPARIVAGRRHSAHQVRQDRRTRRARGRAWPAGEEQGGAGQSGSAAAQSCTTRSMG